MSKDTYYFPHDFDAISDPKLNALVSKYGASGYGIFWRIIEMLHSDAAHKLSHKNYVILSLAQQMSTHVEQISEVLKFAITECELFVSDGSFFWSNRVLRNLDKRKDIIEKRSKAGQKSAEMRKNSTHVEHMSTHVEQNPTKERKGKEIKVKESKQIPELPEFLEHGKILCAKAQLNFSELSFSIESKYQAWKEAGWKDGHGEPIKIWKTKLANTLPHLKPIRVPIQTKPTW